MAESFKNLDKRSKQGKDHEGLVIISKGYILNVPWQNPPLGGDHSVSGSHLPISWGPTFPWSYSHSYTVALTPLLAQCHHMANPANKIRSINED